MALDDKHEAEGRVFKVVGTRPIRPDGVDKVTGRARFGADMSAPGMLVGLVLRSPHAHARIRSIDTSKAEALPGVKAIVTRRDFGHVDPALDEILDADSSEVHPDLRDILHNVMAHDKALYDGHAVAAVAATSTSVARQALKLIEVDYEALPHVTDVDEAMKPGAPVLHEGRSDETVPDGMSANIMHRFEYGHGERKTTWLWLKGLPLLIPTDHVDGREQKVWSMPPGPEREKERSRFFPGIASAMASQWGRA